MSFIKRDSSSSSCNYDSNMLFFAINNNNSQAMSLGSRESGRSFLNVQINVLLMTKINYRDK